MTNPKKPYDTRIVLHLKLILQIIVLHLQNKNVCVQKRYHNHGNWLYDRFALLVVQQLAIMSTWFSFL